MSHKCFISFKTQNIYYKKYIQTNLNVHYIDRSLNIPIESNDEDYILRKIRRDYLSDSTVTIHLIGKYSSENISTENQGFIKRELQASLYNGEGNSKNGILGIVLPEMYTSIYKPSARCFNCGLEHNLVLINDNTVVKEFSYNYYIPKVDGCSWSEDDRYCLLVKWDDFIVNPKIYIDSAFNKRTSQVSKKTKVRP